MKKIFFIALLLIQQNLGAQATTSPASPAPDVEVRKSGDQDTTRIKLGDREIIIINNKESAMSDKKDNENAGQSGKEQKSEDPKEHRRHQHKENTKPGNMQDKSVDVGLVNIDLGVNVLGNHAGASNFSGISEMDRKYVNIKFWSWSTTFNFLPTRIYLGSKNVQLMTSLGWRIGVYKFDSPLLFTPRENLSYTLDTTISHSSLTVQHLQIPLMLYLQSRKIKGFGRLGLGFGGYAGVNVNEHSRIQYANLDRRTETKESFGFERYRYGLCGRLNVGNVRLFANYDLSRTWKDKNFNTLDCGLWFDF